MAQVHLVCGFLGAGKTTFATELAERVDRVRFSVDELYLRLFAHGPTYELDRGALERLFGVLDELWPQVARAGTDVVLDFGFWNQGLRERVRALAQSAGATTRLYWVRCPDELALERCLKRNGAPNAFLISEEGFSELKVHFEAPSPDEVDEVIDTGRRE